MPRKNEMNTLCQDVEIKRFISRFSILPSDVLFKEICILTEEVLLKKIADTMIDGDDDLAGSLCKEAIKKGISALDILMKGCMPGMKRAGELFATSTTDETYAAGGAYLTDLLMAAEAMKRAMEVLKPHLAADKAASSGKYLIGVVEGDLHTIGKDIVATMLMSAGWDVMDLGEDVPLSTFIEKSKDWGANIIGAASAITGTLDKLRELSELIHKQKLPVKFMIGGWSTGAEFALSIGADGFGRDAPDAIKIAEELMIKLKEKRG